MSTDHGVIELLGAQWEKLAVLGAGLDEHQWLRPTDCPTWAVKDVYAHMLGTELSLAGYDAPDLERWPEHVHNELGAFNEAWVEHLRAVASTELLSRFQCATSARLRTLQGMTEDELEADTNTLLGTLPVREFLGVRLMDCWLHEQDVRRATGIPGGLDTPQAAAAVDRLLRTLGYVLARKVAPSLELADGAVVGLRLTGALRRRRAVQVSGGRGSMVDSGARPDASISLDAETYLLLAAGRQLPQQVLDAGLVNLDGDITLGAELIRQLPSIP